MSYGILQARHNKLLVVRFEPQTWHVPGRTSKRYPLSLPWVYVLIGYHEREASIIFNHIRCSFEPLEAGQVVDGADTYIPPLPHLGQTKVCGYGDSLRQSSVGSDLITELANAAYTLISGGPNRYYLDAAIPDLRKAYQNLPNAAPFDRLDPDSILKRLSNLPTEQLHELIRSIPYVPPRELRQ